MSEPKRVYTSVSTTCIWQELAATLLKLTRQHAELLILLEAEGITIAEAATAQRLAASAAPTDAETYPYASLSTEWF